MVRGSALRLEVRDAVRARVPHTLSLPKEPTIPADDRECIGARNLI